MNGDARAFLGETQHEDSFVGKTGVHDFQLPPKGILATDERG
jgi:hypothetical protein